MISKKTAENNTQTVTFRNLAKLFFVTRIK